MSARLSFFIEYRQGPGMSWLCWTPDPIQPVRDPRVAQYVEDNALAEGFPQDASPQACRLASTTSPTLNFGHGVTDRDHLGRAYRQSATQGMERTKQSVHPEWKAVSAVLRSFEDSGCEARAIFWFCP